jgi:hypothetical protein
VPARELLVLYTSSPGTFKTDALARFQRSLKVNRLEEAVTYVPPSSDLAGLKELKVLAERHADDAGAVIMALFDAEDVILGAETKEILRKFETMGADIIFGVDTECAVACEQEWKEGTAVFPHPYSIIGRAPALASALERVDPESTSLLDAIGQLVSHCGTDTCGLDASQEIFINLDRNKLTLEDAKLGMPLEYGDIIDPRLYDPEHDVYPAVVRGNGNSRLLNSIGNYMPMSFSPSEGCLACKAYKQCYAEDDQLPEVLLHLEVPEISPFLEVCFTRGARPRRCVPD